MQPVIDEQIMETVHDIFGSVMKLNPLDDLFEDLANRLIDDLAANSLLDYNLELSDDQKEQLRKAVKEKGTDTVHNYQANLNSDERTKLVYGLVRERTTAIADSLLSSIGKEINRGTIINCRAVQANSKNEKYDEILLRKSKSSGDITVPTECILLSSNCVEIFKASCQEAKEEEAADETEPGEDTEKVAEKKPKKAGRNKK
ncbi:hypothetical protein FACS189468_5560 [Spirochaetia bacterium]|nr:hypothetical protein FACS189468_5560 [Spirochaetia bacterium]